MPDVPNSHRDISALLNERKKTRDVEIAEMDEVEAAILYGHIPQAYEKLFTSTDVPLQLRTLRSADDNLTTLLSEVPILPHVDPQGKRVTDTARNKAEVVEKAAFGWMAGASLRGGPEFDMLAHELATHQVRFGDGCVLIHPDHDRKLVYLEVVDPRCHFPPVRWHPASMSPLDGTLFVYEMTLAEVKRRFAYDIYGVVKSDVMGRLNNAFKPIYGPDSTASTDDAQIVQVGMYRSREAWYVCALSDTDVVLAESEIGDRHHPGVTGAVSFKQFARGPLFTGQIGIEAALMKVVNQQIQNTERINKAPITGPPLLGDTLRWGEYNVVDLALLQNRSVPVQRHAPDSPNNLTQVMGSLLSLAQMFNYNPESMMGAGDANSGKAIQQLQAGPRALVTNILWSPYKPAFPRIFDDCLEMELNLWPNEKKTVRGKNGKTSFEVEYTPSAALQGFKGHIKIEEARMGGYNAFLEAGQKKDMGLISKRSVMEADPDIRDVETELRRISSERNEDFIRTGFEALGGQDPFVAVKVAIEVGRLIDTGMSEAEARQKVVQMGMLDPPPPPEPEAMPPLPPELAGMVGGAGAVEPPPALSEARGF